MAARPRQPASFVSAPGNRNTIELLGATITPLVVGASTSGALAVIEYSAPPHHRGLAPHWHKQTTETFYVMDGTVAFMLGEETITAARGATIVVPPCVIHSCWNPTAAPATVLSWCMPAGFEQYWAELAALIAAETVWPPADRGKLAALDAKHDVWSSGA